MKKTLRYIAGIFLPELLLQYISRVSPNQWKLVKNSHIHLNKLVAPLITVYPKGSLMIGRDCKLHSGTVIMSDENFYSHTYNKCLFGDIIIGRNVRINDRLILKPGTIVPDNAVVRCDAELNMLRNKESLWSHIAIDENPNRPSPIFILSTGRSGSTSLASALNDLKGYLGKHESIKALTMLGYLKEHNPTLFQKYRNSLIQRLKYAHFISGAHVWAESDQRLYNLIPELIECFPSGKFIHIIREKNGFIRSATKRGWYDSKNEKRHIWERYRPHPTEGDLVFNNWTQLNQTEKTEWYYDNVNKGISEGLQAHVPASNKLTIHLEDSNINEILSQFVGQEVRLPHLN